MINIDYQKWRKACKITHITTCSQSYIQHAFHHLPFTHILMVAVLLMLAESDALTVCYSWLCSSSCPAFLSHLMHIHQSAFYAPYQPDHSYLYLFLKLLFTAIIMELDIYTLNPQINANAHKYLRVICKCHILPGLDWEQFSFFNYFFLLIFTVAFTTVQILLSSTFYMSALFRVV